MSWATVENKLIVDGEVAAVFPYPVRVAKEIQGTVVVILDLPHGVCFPRNAYGYVLSEKHLWQIEKYCPASDSELLASDPYIPVLVTDFTPQEVPGQVVLWTWLCIILYVDLRSGKILKTFCSK